MGLNCSCCWTREAPVLGATTCCCCCLGARGGTPAAAVLAGCSKAIDGCIREPVICESIVCCSPPGITAAVDESSTGLGLASGISFGSDDDDRGTELVRVMVCFAADSKADGGAGGNEEDEFAEAGGTRAGKASSLLAVVAWPRSFDGSIGISIDYKQVSNTVSTITAFGLVGMHG